MHCLVLKSMVDHSEQCCGIKSEINWTTGWIRQNSGKGEREMLIVQFRPWQSVKIVKSPNICCLLQNSMCRYLHAFKLKQRISIANLVDNDIISNVRSPCGTGGSVWVMGEWSVGQLTVGCHQDSENICLCIRFSTL